jgi:hypothetical protein
MGRLIQRIKMIWNCEVEKNAGHAYCLKCYHDYTYQEYSELAHRKHYPQFTAYAMVCKECGGEKWRFLG